VGDHRARRRRRPTATTPFEAAADLTGTTAPTPPLT
jgi:hypothetical protein